MKTYSIFLTYSFLQSKTLGDRIGLEVNVFLAHVSGAVRLGSHLHVSAAVTFGEEIGLLALISALHLKTKLALIQWPFRRQIKDYLVPNERPFWLQNQEILCNSDVAVFPRFPGTTTCC